jgi:ADP-ribosylglycohydrolase
MISDDTEHTLFVAQSLLSHPRSPEAFGRRLAWALRWWLVTLPAGVGFATLRSILRLWLGVRPSRSGVYSAGNGPAMRVAPIGSFFASSADRLDDFVSAATRVTHTDPKALVGAKAVAYLAAWSVRGDLRERPTTQECVDVLRRAGPDDEEWLRLLGAMSNAHARDVTVGDFARSLGLAKGVTGYVYHTVPIVVYAWLRHFGDFSGTLQAVLDCGGDTDTTGAIAGALAGAVAGGRGIPARWIDGIVDWPRSPGLLVRVADRMADASTGAVAPSPVRYFWPALPLRNLFFLLVILLHGLRRLAPPY